MEDRARQDGEQSRLKLNIIQVAAGALAAISSAVAASYLSVGGTIIGAAIGSVVTTTAGAVYSHYLERTQSRLRNVVTPVLDRTGIASVVVAEESARAGTSNPGAPDLEQPAASDMAAVTEGSPGGEQAGTGENPAPATARAAASSTGSSPGWEISWRRLAPLGGMVVLIFALAMGAITLFETGTGQPVSATVGGQENVSARTSFGAIAKGETKKDEQKQDEDKDTPGDKPSDAPSNPGDDQESPDPGKDRSENPTPDESESTPEQPDDGQPTGESDQQESETGTGTTGQGEADQQVPSGAPRP